MPFLHAFSKTYLWKLFENTPLGNSKNYYTIDGIQHTVICTVFFIFGSKKKTKAKNVQVYNGDHHESLFSNIKPSHTVD